MSEPEDAVNRPTSFRLHISPLFRQGDLQSMDGIVDLASYEKVKAKSSRILARLRARDGSMMPPVEDDGPWPDEWIALFARWIAEGHQP